MTERKVAFNGRETIGCVIAFESEKESWNTYVLEDGTTLRMKAVLTSVVRLDEYNAQGGPIYVISAQNVMDADVPEQLRRSVSCEEEN